ncbi:unnamed protein product [Phaeothamnion confervicola]
MKALPTAGKLLVQALGIDVFRPLMHALLLGGAFVCVAGGCAIFLITSGLVGRVLGAASTSGSGLKRKSDDSFFGGGFHYGSPAPAGEDDVECGGYSYAAKPRPYTKPAGGGPFRRSVSHRSGSAASIPGASSAEYGLTPTPQLPRPGNVSGGRSSGDDPPSGDGSGGGFAVAPEASVGAAGMPHPAPGGGTRLSSPLPAQQQPQPPPPGPVIGLGAVPSPTLPLPSPYRGGGPAFAAVPAGGRQGAGGPLLSPRDHHQRSHGGRARRFSRPHANEDSLGSVQEFEDLGLEVGTTAAFGADSPQPQPHPQPQQPQVRRRDRPSGMPQPSLPLPPPPVLPPQPRDAGEQQPPPLQPHRPPPLQRPQAAVPPPLPPVHAGIRSFDYLGLPPAHSGDRPAPILTGEITPPWDAGAHGRWEGVDAPDSCDGGGGRGGGGKTAGRECGERTDSGSGRSPADGARAGRAGSLADGSREAKADRSTALPFRGLRNSSPIYKRGRILAADGGGEAEGGASGDDDEDYGDDLTHSDIGDLGGSSGDAVSDERPLGRRRRSRSRGDSGAEFSRELLVAGARLGRKGSGINFRHGGGGGGGSDRSPTGSGEERCFSRKNSGVVVLGHARFEIPYSELQIGILIGGGGFGQVYRATWRGTAVAVKVLIAAAQDEMDEQVLDDFRAEVEILAGLRHPNICLFMGACLAPPHRAIVTELVSRGSLWEVLREPAVPRVHGGPAQSTYQTPAGCWPWAAILQVADGTACGMNYLHCNDPPILHRDLKSANLLLDDSFRVRLCDFGLARLKAFTNSMTGNCGTVQWMAPEVLANAKYSETADVYSFGVVCWEMLTRACPFEGMSQIQAALAVLNNAQRPPIPEWCPASMRGLIEACWHQDPAQRPSFATILECLRGDMAPPTTAAAAAGVAAGAAAGSGSGTSAAVGAAAAVSLLQRRDP